MAWDTVRHTSVCNKLCDNSKLEAWSAIGGVLTNVEIGEVLGLMGHIRTYNGTQESEPDSMLKYARL